MWNYLQVEYYKVGLGVNQKDAELFNSLSEIAFDKRTPQYLREYAVDDILKLNAKNIPDYKKFRFLSMLISGNLADEKFSSFLQKKLLKLSPKKPPKKRHPQKRPLTKIVIKDPVEQFITTTLAHLNRNLTKASPWGTKLPSEDFSKIQELVKLNEHGFYVHRNLITNQPLIPYRVKSATLTKKIAIPNVNLWKSESKPILQSYCSETEEIIEARQRFRIISNRLNVEDRYLLKDLAFGIETTLSNLTLRYDFVGLHKNDLGIKGSWVISIFGVEAEMLETMLDFNWSTLKTFLKKSKISSRGMSKKLLETTVLIESHTDEDAQKEIGFFLEELLVFILGTAITNFQLHEKKLSPAQFSKRSVQIDTLTKRTRWIARHPRGPYVNNCIVCGKPLSVSISIDRAIGPQCWKKLTKVEKIKKIDLKPGYSPLHYETTITTKQFLDNVCATFESLR